MTPLRSAPGLDGYDRELGRPVPSLPQFALDSEVWRRELGIQPPMRTPRLGEPGGRLA
jgi:hypothetical protein